MKKRDNTIKMLSPIIMKSTTGMPIKSPVALSLLNLLTGKHLEKYGKLSGGLGDTLTRKRSAVRYRPGLPFI